jgi:hypothetical protein
MPLQRSSGTPIATLLLTSQSRRVVGTAHGMRTLGAEGQAARAGAPTKREGVRRWLVAIHYQHYIYKAIVRIIEIPGIITKRENDSYDNLEAVGWYRCNSIYFFSKQVMVTAGESNTVAIYRGHCRPNDCSELDSLL